MKKANVKSTTKSTKFTVVKPTTKIAIRPGHRLVNGKPCTGKFCDQHGCPTCGATLAETMIPANRPAKPTWDGTSAALPTPEAVAAAYAPVKARPRQAGHKVVAKGKAHMTVKKAAVKATKAVKATPKAAPAVESEEKVTKAMAAAAKVAAKKLEPPTASLLHKALKKAGFKFVQAQQAEGTVAYGYVHKDQRAALLTTAADGAEAWQVRFTDGATSGGVKPDLFTALLRVTTAKHDFSKMRATEKVVRAAAKSPIDTSVLGVGSDGDDYRAPVKIKPEEVAGVPAAVARAVEMLGGLTSHRFDLDMLRGDKHYGHRLALLKRLFDREKVLVAETGINNLTEAFFSAVGTDDGCKASKMECFAQRCKDIVKKVRVAKADEKKNAEALAKIKLRNTAAQRALPGTILPGSPRLTRKQQLVKDAEDRQYVLSLSASQEQPAVPHPEAELSLVAEDLKLLEDPENGIVMMQMEKANSQGAICVYNNGSRVAAGVVAPETLKKLRIMTNVDLVKSAQQLLNPVVPSVPVTPVAARHLTAVVHCKELIPMMATATAPLSTGRKFAAPASTKTTKPAKAEKATPTASKKSIAVGKEKAAKAVKAERVTEDRKIKSLVKFKDLGMREGTFCHAQVQAALSSKTVSEAQAKLDADKDNPSQGRKIEIAWMVKKEFISVA